MNKEILIKKGYELLEKDDLDELKEKLQEWKIQISNSEDALPVKCIEQCCHQLTFVDVEMFSKEKRVKEYRQKIHSAIKTLECFKENVCEANCLNVFLENFDMFLEKMFYTMPENKSTLSYDLLQSISINNEYDLQHIMFAVIKAMYPDARREVCHDTGYGNVRYDIFIDTLDTVIELKCSRKDYNDKKLLAELGEDAFFYHCSRLLMYVYDKHKVIKDVVNFKKALEKKTDKEIKVFINQN